MNKGFVKATSENLPVVDLDMLSNFILNNYVSSPEMKGVKALRSTRENYGDQAIEYVQLKRHGSLCTVEAKICPEHKVRAKSYKVEVVINEVEESVEKAQCHDCTASLGGCKHAVAVLAWMFRRAGESSPTSVICYWKKSTLSKVGSSIKYKKISEMFGDDQNEQVSDAEQSTQDFLSLVLSHEKSKLCRNSHLISFFVKSNAQKHSLHFLGVIFRKIKGSSEDFLKFCTEQMSYAECLKISQATSDQSNSRLWFELRYGRITGSTIYEAAQCQTQDGSLVEKILSFKKFDTPAMKRGRELEGSVLMKVEKQLKGKFDNEVNKKLLSKIEQEVKKKKNENVKRTGLLLNKKYPFLGASPDGITETFVIEVKCPIKNSTVSRYYTGKDIQSKFRAQLQLSMFFSGKKKGLFCIANPDFEKNNKVVIVEDTFDASFVSDCIKKSLIFWKNNIFPYLIR